jgi:murein DD-endopeptidase MepM/ murein hydrolase activator NlpD
MDQKAKRKMAANAVYILTAVIVVSIMCMTLYTAFDSANRSAETEAPELSPGDVGISDETDGLSPVNTPETEPSIPAAEPVTGPVEPAINNESADTGVQASAPEYTPPTYIMPVSGNIIKSYDDSVPVFSLTMNDYRVHAGIDLEAEVGCAVFACSDGVITDIYTDPFWGSCITISHGDGMTSNYMNLSAELPQNIDEGVTVSTGDIIGSVGDTALIEMADSNHIHFEMRINGTVVNPLAYIPYNMDAVAATTVE